MTRTQFDKKYRRLLKGVRAYLLKEGERLYKSGGVDPSSYFDDFQLPRIIITAAIKNQIEQVRPYSRESQKIVKNLTLL